MSATPTAIASAAASAPASLADVVVDGSPSASGAPAALYAKLFSPGATWQVTARYTVATGMTSPPSQRKTTARGSCTVAAVERRDWALVARVTCKGLDAEGALDPDPFTGTWAATSVALFHFDADPGEKPPPLTRSAFVLSADPSPLELEEPGPDPRFGPAWFVDVAKTADRWCSTQGASSSGPASVQRCIHPERGFVSASASVTTGMTVYLVELDVTRFTPGKQLPAP